MVERELPKLLVWVRFPSPAYLEEHAMLRTAYFNFIGVILLSLVSLSAYAIDGTDNVEWGYKGSTGPMLWGQLTPTFRLCKEGKNQTPINITKNVVPAEYSLTIHYGNTGVDQENIVNTGHSIQVNFLPTSNENIMIKGKTYKLVQFHMHTPSETQLLGRAYPMEIHFVNQAEDGSKAVLAVLANGGSENAELQKIIKNIPKGKNQTQPISGSPINPAQLLPKGTNYYSFMGSLTTPPCEEGLQWIVLKDPIQVSPAQIVSLRQAIGGVNARPVQPLKGRQIFYHTKQ